MTESSCTSLDQDYEPCLSSLFLYTIPIFEDSQNSLMKIQDNGDANIGVGPQALPTLLKTIAVRKDAYPSLIVHSPKCPRRTQEELMDAANPSICQQ